MLLDIYELGLIIEYLTPACPAKCIIISILFLYLFISFEKFFLLVLFLLFFFLKLIHLIKNLFCLLF